MSFPDLAFSDADLLSIETDVVVIGTTRSESGPKLLSEDPRILVLDSALNAIGCTGAQDEFLRLPPLSDAHRGIALVGLGSSEVSENSLRLAAGAALRSLKGVRSVVLALPAQTPREAVAIAEGAGLGGYSFTEYRSDALLPESRGADRVIVATSLTAVELTPRASAIARAVSLVKDLVNTPPNDLYPRTFAERADDLGTDVGVDVEILDESALEAGGFGGLLGVGQGSQRGPRLVKLSYSPPSARRHLSLVGKGITFDSGGLSLKPPASMIGMKYDMTGAATVLAVAIAVAELRMPVRLTAWLCLAENMPSGDAMRPGDVITIRGGKTVEVLNTDAEGRLVLADGLVAASEDTPDAIVDVATLTGAASVAMGTRYVAVMGDPDLSKSLVAAATRVGETFWHMPIGPESRPLLNSDIADIANVKPGNTAGGMTLAAAFLREFVGARAEPDVGPIPWAHLDIAGTASNSGTAWGFTGKGPTAVSVRALIELCEEFSGS